LANYFPPKPVYPKGYDDDYTLYLVYNTSETVTTQDNLAWSDNISIKPVGADEDEIWGENGFANINGELFYYDGVEKDVNNKINKFKRCARNVGGKETKFNTANAEVRGFVIAEHHNQIIDAIINIENFIGYDFTPTLETLDYKIRNLRELTLIFDDFTCPDITFTFNTIETSPINGTLAQYIIAIEGSYTSFRLDFGDGQFTDSELRGTHRYSANSIIDPIVTAANDNCTVTTSAKERTEANEPTQIESVTTIDITLPNIPDLPPFIYPSLVIPSSIINFPPIVFPCLDIGPISPINIPSVIIIDPPLPTSISITPIKIPSTITITPINIPSTISITPINIPSTISITPINIPSTISITPINVPSTISITPISIPNIKITPITIPDIKITPIKIPDIKITPIKIPDIKITPITIPNIKITPITIPDVKITPILIPNIKITPIIIPNIKITPITIPDIKITPITIPDIKITPIIIPPITVKFDPPPPIPVDYGSPPPIPVDWGSPPTVTCQIQVQCPSGGMRSKGFDSLQDSIENPSLEVEIADIGIPSEIRIIAPELKDIHVLSDIPERIRVEAINIPSSIKFDTGKFVFPSEIKLVSENIPSRIELFSKFEIPSRIELFSTVPSSIKLELADNFPSIFRLEAIGIPEKIQVTGMPSTIELVGAPSEIRLVMPDKPEIEMVYKGAPIDVKINLDISKLTGDKENLNCVAIVPCKP
jgi:hypothetical protein